MRLALCLRLCGGGSATVAAHPFAAGESGDTPSIIVGLRPMVAFPPQCQDGFRPPRLTPSGTARQDRDSSQHPPTSLAPKPERLPSPAPQPPEQLRVG